MDNLSTLGVQRSPVRGDCTLTECAAVQKGAWNNSPPRAAGLPCGTVVWNSPPS